MQVWDTRQQSCCNSFDAHEEYISDMTFASDSMKLLEVRKGVRCGLVFLGQVILQHAKSRFSYLFLVKEIWIPRTPWKVGKELANHILSIVGGLDNIVCCVCLFLKEPLLGWE
ncbi:hypothetical protein CK203_049160 [Vitis vinifera]|uniref:Uncharacterized protein n=1 Tax=Vitis vinifera TaxID=29760 RepID=A0A438GV59_VITVI|nr:hypothetical protein CK203_049160 [Vitis vinifera]